MHAYSYGAIILLYHHYSISLYLGEGWVTIMHATNSFIHVLYISVSEYILWCVKKSKADTAINKLLQPSLKDPVISYTHSYASKRLVVLLSIRLLWGDLGGTSRWSGPNTIKLKMYNSHIFLIKKRTRTTSESTCLGPIVVQFYHKDNSIKSLIQIDYDEHKTFSLVVVFLDKWFDCVILK